MVLALVCFPIVASQPSWGQAANYHITDIAAGDTADIFFEINIAGKVYLSIRGRSGSECVDLWWIRWPLGSVDRLGKRCGNIALKIPGLADTSVAAKLRGRAINGPVKIVGSSNESVAFDFPPFSFP
jgi:hypothetical protein